MEIKHTENKRDGEFYIDVDGNKVAVIEYIIRNNSRLYILHTEVDAVLSGQGIGKMLVEAVADFALENNFTLKPVCPYAAAVLNKKSSTYKDILEK